MNKIELLAPAGNLEKAKIAILYGANAVYIGGKQFSLRSRASNFDINDIRELVQFANEHHARVHVTVNMLPHPDDLEGLKDYLLTLDAIGVHAIIVASPAIMRMAKQLGCRFEVHVSTQHSTTNSQAVAFWKKQGMDRVVLARECGLEQIRNICEQNVLPIEVFIHGGYVYLLFGALRTIKSHDLKRCKPRWVCPKLSVEIPSDGAGERNQYPGKSVFHVQ